jgi:predicted nucleotidyltransferase
MKTRNEIINKLQEIKPILQKEWAVETVGLFGSFADESNTASSDIDIMVEFNKPVGWNFFTLEDYLEKQLNHKIDLVTKNSLKEQIKPMILSQIQYI